MAVLSVQAEQFALKGAFRISRGAKTAADVLGVTLDDDGIVGRGEGVPYARYGESMADAIGAIEAMRSAIEALPDRDTLRDVLPAGAARSAVDAALWDLEARRAGVRVWQLLGHETFTPVTTAYTISLDDPEKMYMAARDNASRPRLKLKLAGPDDLTRVQAVRRGAPDADLIVDANEGWDITAYRALVPELAGLGVSMIEQPLPAGADAALAELPRPIAVCADEAWHDPRDIAHLAGRYDMINIKLDKTGGLTEALDLVMRARAMGLGIMIGCMMSTSLAMAPALMLAGEATVVDLDGPLWLARDRDPPLCIEGSRILAPPAALWG